MGGLPSADRRNADAPASPQAARQRALLARLIGGDPVRAEAVSAQLIDGFGSIGGVLGASEAALRRLVDDPELANRLAAARPVVLESLGETLRRSPFDLADVHVQRWIVGLFKGLQVERVHVALLNRDGHMICDEAISEGALRGVSVNLRKIVSRGFDVGASAAILMHNHPSGDANPSAADIRETRKISFLLESLDMRLADHVIVAGNVLFSMRGARLL